LLNQNFQVFIEVDEREATHGNMATVPFPGGEFDAEETGNLSCLLKIRLEPRSEGVRDRKMAIFHLIELTNTSEEKAMGKFVQIFQNLLGKYVARLAIVLCRKE
jgi:hypothetical protein